MASRLPAILRSYPIIRITCFRAMSGGQFGDGEGKGGGSGGSIRSAGGAFGKMEATKEEQYFRQLQKEQVEKLKHMLEDELSHHEAQIKQHQQAIEHHKKKLERIHKTKDGSDSD